MLTFFVSLNVNEFPASSHSAISNILFIQTLYKDTLLSVSLFSEIFALYKSLTYLLGIQTAFVYYQVIKLIGFIFNPFGSH